jgi:hypothetical protein
MLKTVPTAGTATAAAYLGTSYKKLLFPSRTVDHISF